MSRRVRRAREEQRLFRIDFEEVQAGQKRVLVGKLAMHHLAIRFGHSQASLGIGGQKHRAPAQTRKQGRRKFAKPKRVEVDNSKGFFAAG